MNNNDTICALATPTGGALAIIRLSGPQSLPIISAISPLCCNQVAANTIHYTNVKDGEDIIDEVVISIFRSPHSYTGEDAAEISFHGSPYIAQKLLALLIQQGCRQAAPGEFTQRAFLNGKLDLSQAEAVADLIASTNRATHQLAMSQLRGHFSSELSRLRSQLLKLTSLLELELDFSDHEDLEFANRTELLTLAQTIETHISTLAHSFETGQALKQGIPVAIVGKTNVGKSTLLNRLLHEDRAIVSDIHGTTRDTIEDTIHLQGIPFRFIDTAGIRQTEDQVEQIGIQRTYQAIQKARIVLWLIDKQPTETELQDIKKRAEGKTLLLVQTKSDLYPPLHLPNPLLPPCPQCSNTVTAPSLISISAKTGTGIDSLEQLIYQSANLPTLSDTDIIVTSARHYQALTQARQNLLRVLDGLQTHLPADLIAEDLRLVLTNLADITGQGQITPQETLNNIFSHFCVGK